MTNNLVKTLASYSCEYSRTQTCFKLIIFLKKNLYNSVFQNIRESFLSQQDGSASKHSSCQSWWPKCHPQSPCGRRAKSVPEICSLTSTLPPQTCCACMCMQNKNINFFQNFKNHPNSTSTVVLTQAFFEIETNNKHLIDLVHKWWTTPEDDETNLPSALF